LKNNILILSAGRRVSLVQGFKSAMSIENDLDGLVFTADMSPSLSAACQISDGFFYLPHVFDENYPNALMALCKKQNIKLVIPTIDTELPVLSSLRAFFLEAGINLIVSSKELISDCSDKRRTAVLFKKYSLPTPKIYNKDNLKFPLLVKPYDGSLSSGIVVVESKDQITNKISSNLKNIYCQYIDHNDYSEYTIDLYYDRNNRLRCVVPRKRLEVRGGEVSKALTDRNEIVQYIFQSLNILEGAIGCLTLQLFRHNETLEYWCIEINARFGGGYPLSRLAGADFQLWLLKEYFKDEEIMTNNSWKNHALMLRYDAEVFISV
jgi:carbamoyl-phosphate synthase large subunit